MSAPMSAPMLQVSGLGKTFGGLKAVQGLSFDVNQGEIVGLIGPNGAGKSTAFNMICGALAPTAGSVRFEGEEIAGLAPSQVVRRGLARTFQSASVYAKATVEENLFRGSLCRLPFQGQLLRPAAHRARLAEVRRDIERIQALTGLDRYRDKLAGDLPYGFQKRLGVAIGLASRPRMLLLDEPAAGLNPEECAAFGRLLRQLRTEFGLTLLFVEHHMALVMELCERIVVLVQGQKIAQGRPEQIRADAAVIEAYLGTDDDAHA